MSEALYAVLVFCAAIVSFALVQCLFEAKNTLREVGRAAFRAASVMEKTERQIDKTDSVVSNVAETVNLYNRVAHMPANGILNFLSYLKSAMSR